MKKSEIVRKISEMKKIIEEIEGSSEFDSDLIIEFIEWILEDEGKYSKHILKERVDDN